MRIKILSLVTLLTLFISLIHLSTSFVPQDNYLINCGSERNIIVDNRNFLGDSTKSGLAHLSQGNSISLKGQTGNSNLSLVYSTARVFSSPSAYSFNIKKVGTHFVRLHFSPFISQNYNLHSANFSVSANGILLVKILGVGSTVVKELIVMVDEAELQILFNPTQGFGFVNAIEVFSAPDDFIIDPGIKLISPNSVGDFNQNVTYQTLETVYRINVGGEKITPFNDTLWRTWIPDEDFLVLKSAAKLAWISESPNYQKGGATKEIAPDNVYMTAQQMNWEKATSNFMFNITWSFPVGTRDSVHFVRLHFCDIVSSAPSQLYFNVYINGVMAYKDLDLSALTFHVLASPYYIDFVVDTGNNGGVLQVSVGPSDMSSAWRKNAILNGVEIMKMLNVVGLRDGESKKKKNVWILVVTVISGVALVSFGLLGILVLFKCRKRKPKTKRSESAGWTPLRQYGGGSSLGTLSEGTGLVPLGPNGYLALRIPFADIQVATSNFNKSLIIGSGGFGMVYKGVLKDNNLKVAVKRCVPGSRQGLPEFHTEISVLSKIRHRHLVSLVGYCEEQSEMILVYEYVENGPLKKHLYGGRLPPLSWKKRLDVCIGAARGLHYLHTGFAQGIIHRDIKSTNILLDENYVAKVADFGLSRSGPCIDETHVSTGVKGSFGYLDPEYFRRQQLTDKSDVYSFGVVLFEVLCARPAVDPLLEREQVNLGEWALQWQKRGQIDQVVDPNIRDQIKPNALKKFGETAEKCLAEYGVDRPTMGDVLWNLEYVLQLQENGGARGEPPEEVNLPTPTNLPISTPILDDDNGVLDISTSKVFSQLITNEGR